MDVDIAVLGTAAASCTTAICATHSARLSRVSGGRAI